MLDLIYVNLIAIAFDILVMTFIYLNELGISHRIQTFSYILKLKLEFVVLNQLMAVAARGIQKASWEKKRYHHPSLGDTFSAECRRWGGKSPPTPQIRDSPRAAPESSAIPPMDLEMPSPVMSRSHRKSVMSSPEAQSVSDRMDLNRFNFGAEPQLELHSFSSEGAPTSDQAQTLQMRPSQSWGNLTASRRISKTREPTSIPPTHAQCEEKDVELAQSPPTTS